jgi:hypothetical protein
MKVQIKPKEIEKRHRIGSLYLGIQIICGKANGSLAADVLRNPRRRERYDFFLKNGFPEWYTSSTA